MKTLTALYNLIVTWNGGVLAILASAVTSLIAVIAWVNTLWAELIAKLALVTVVNGTSVSFSAVGLIDTFFPLTETLSFFTAWFALLVACATVRIVKSFIPTVAT